jgi:hypothetical protein
MRKIVSMALVAAFGLAAGVPAFADSRSAAEFVLKTCLPAMDDLSKVEIMARENIWTPKSVPSEAVNKFQTSRSMWDVAQGDERVSVDVWINHFGRQDHNVCFVGFPSNNVNREEFLSVMSASVKLTLISDTVFAQIQMRTESYEIKSANNLSLGIVSRPEGNVTLASIQENVRFSALPAAPAVPSQIDR